VRGEESIQDGGIRGDVVCVCVCVCDRSVRLSFPLRAGISPHRVGMYPL